MAFRGQVAVITGASSGIGWELAKQLAAGGCKVGLVARRREHLEKLAAEIRQAGGTAVGAAADVGERAATVAAVHGLARELGPVDLLIANAGLARSTYLQPLNVPDVEAMVRVNLLGVVYAIEAVLPEMLRRGSGHLVGVSSLAGLKGLPGDSGYCATKAAVNTYLEGLRIHLHGRGVAVTTVCPGFVHTEMTADFRGKMPWVMDADRAARLIVRALERRVKVYHFPWQALLLMRLTRWLPDRTLLRFMRKLNIKPPPPPAPEGSS
jgi:short-subunit dehydrogenase